MILGLTIIGVGLIAAGWILYLIYKHDENECPGFEEEYKKSKKQK